MTDPKPVAAPRQPEGRGPVARLSDFTETIDSVTGESLYTQSEPEGPQDLTDEEIANGEAWLAALSDGPVKFFETKIETKMLARLLAEIKRQARWRAWRDGLATKNEAALVKAFRDFAQHLPGCSWGGWLDETHDKCDCGLSAAVRACPPLRKAIFK